MAVMALPRTGVVRESSGSSRMKFWRANRGREAAWNKRKGSQSAAWPQGGRAVRRAGATRGCESGPSHSPLEPFQAATARCSHGPARNQGTTERTVAERLTCLLCHAMSRHGSTWTQGVWVGGRHRYRQRYFLPAAPIPDRILPLPAHPRAKSLLPGGPEELLLNPGCQSLFAEGAWHRVPGAQAASLCCRNVGGMLAAWRRGRRDQRGEEGRTEARRKGGQGEGQRGKGGRAHQGTPGVWLTSIPSRASLALN